MKNTSESKKSKLWGALLATIMNCIYVSEIFRSVGMQTQILTPFECGSMTKLFSKDRANKYFAKGMVVFFALTDSQGQFTLENIARGGEYMSVLLRSIKLAAIATVLCVLIAYPLAYILSRKQGFQKQTLFIMVMLPMWMNFLLRTFAWMTILENNGLINKFLGLFGIGPLHMINTQGAVILGMVYNYIPFMILPIYTTMCKIGNDVIEAAQDLGGNTFQVMARVVIPLSLPGVSTGITMVFVPAISTFIISKMLVGGSNQLIGDIIELQFLGNSYNPNLGSAISLVLMVVVLLCMSIMNNFDDEEMEGRIL